MTTQKEQRRDDSTERVKIADDAKARAALDKIRKRDRELLNRLAK